ncbi:MAG: hypothetical protein JSV21_06335 [Nitrospirota bacterium]|nr:MAG: hypothetical protein JSV21_06335 [Nitrospirota bacterium]
MGERELYQPLTKHDKLTVVLYRTGIVLTAILLSVMTIGLYSVTDLTDDRGIGVGFALLTVALYIAVGLSVMFIHLYVSRFHTFLKRLYYLSVAGLLSLIFISKGSMLALLIDAPYYSLMFLPLAGCLGFVTAKEAFCFRLNEG